MCETEHLITKTPLINMYNVCIMYVQILIVKPLVKNLWQIFNLLEEYALLGYFSKK